MLPNLDIQVYTQFASSEESHPGGVGVQTNLMVTGCVRREREAALGTILPGQYHLAVRVLHFYMHAQARGRGQEDLLLLVPHLGSIVADDHGLVGYFLDEATLLSLADVEIEPMGTSSAHSEHQQRKPHHRLQPLDPDAGVNS